MKYETWILLARWKEIDQFLFWFYLQSRIQFWLKLSMLQNKTPVKVFGCRNLLFREEKAIKY